MSSLAQQLGVSGVFYVIGLGSLPGRFMLHMPNDLSMKIVDRIMGGPGLNIESSRDLTELEVDLLTQVVERLITDLRESWSGTILLNPRIDDTALNLMLVPICLAGRRHCHRHIRSAGAGARQQYDHGGCPTLC